ncbi:carboxyl-terminal processing protease [Polymorphobacter multimanifer]|uniref:Carboxyl-terminal processing protease n=2 Tax=Polymorphobacter multimanifer TaxID=1070431 RepID=A0A841L7B7_9SPHN|nr:S41 family peptidase [Polymorphobacter multimanifer]MBB6226843.1 carboxyl-terminal processing protease [Polymorphobacter multimanifer]
MTMSPQKKILLVGIGVAALAGTATVRAAAQSDTYKQLDALMDVFEQVRVTYVDKVDDKTLIDGAINGMLASLDPHSNYLDQRDFASMRQTTDGEYGGLGLSVSIEDGAVKVIAPMDDTPGARAGIKPGDYITHIEGELIYGQPLNEAVDRMRGLAGSKIAITIARQGEAKPLQFSLTREVIQIRPVKWEVKNNVGIVRISTFNKQTGPATRDAVAAIDKKLGAALSGYVIDLRSNPGGLLDQAIEVSDVFLDKGEIVSQRGRAKGDIIRYHAKAGDLTHGKPIVILVDEGSASAAEIVAGALQDHRRAMVIGERSFGKGSVQTLIPLGEGTGLRITTARYFTPSGRSVQEAGIEPDVSVPQLSDALRGERPRRREADLTRHLINEVKDGTEKLVETDEKPDPRFTQTADELKKAGVLDFQLDYAVKMLGRLAPAATVQMAEAAGLSPAAAQR